MKITSDKRDKIKEHIISVLYKTSPKALFTADIAHEIARDEEFTKKLLQEMREQGFVILVNMNPNGKLYTRRMRWRLNSHIYDAYKKLHTPS